MGTIEHVFVLMLENRSFDHMLGFSRLSGTDATSGEPTRLDGLTGGEANALSSGERVQVSGGADFTLEIDPGHEFEDVLEQLGGAGATYPAANGGYPPVDNSGFASRLARRGGDPSLVMKAFRPEQLPVMNALGSEFACPARAGTRRRGCPSRPTRACRTARTRGSRTSPAS